MTTALVFIAGLTLGWALRARKAKADCWIKFPPGEITLPPGAPIEVGPGLRIEGNIWE